VTRETVDVYATNRFKIGWPSHRRSPLTLVPSTMPSCYIARLCEFHSIYSPPPPPPPAPPPPFTRMATPAPNPEWKCRIPPCCESTLTYLVITMGIMNFAMLIGSGLQWVVFGGFDDINAGDFYVYYFASLVTGAVIIIFGAMCIAIISACLYFLYTLSICDWNNCTKQCARECSSCGSECKNECCCIVYQEQYEDVD